MRSLLPSWRVCVTMAEMIEIYEELARAAPGDLMEE
jgi:hypothetical protein